MLGVIAQHELLGIQVEIQLFVHPVWDRIAVQVTVQSGQVPVYEAVPGGLLSYSFA
jgi:hypothetical protein